MLAGEEADPHLGEPHHVALEDVPVAFHQRAVVEEEALGVVGQEIPAHGDVAGLLHPQADACRAAGEEDLVALDEEVAAVHGEDADLVAHEAVLFQPVAMAVHEMDAVATAAHLVAPQHVARRVPDHAVAGLLDLVVLHQAVVGLPEADAVSSHPQRGPAEPHDPVSAQSHPLRLFHQDAEDAVEDGDPLDPDVVAVDLDGRVEHVEAAPAPIDGHSTERGAVLEEHGGARSGGLQPRALGTPDAHAARHHHGADPGTIAQAEHLTRRSVVERRLERLVRGDRQTGPGPVRAPRAPRRGGELRCPRAGEEREHQDAGGEPLGHRSHADHFFLGSTRK